MLMLKKKNISIIVLMLALAQVMNPVYATAKTFDLYSLVGQFSLAENAFADALDQGDLSDQTEDKTAIKQLELDANNLMQKVSDQKISIDQKKLDSSVANEFDRYFSKMSDRKADRILKRMIKSEAKNGKDISRNQIFSDKSKSSKQKLQELKVKGVLLSHTKEVKSGFEKFGAKTYLKQILGNYQASKKHASLKHIDEGESSIFDLAVPSAHAKKPGFCAWIDFGGGYYSTDHCVSYFLIVAAIILWLAIIALSFTMGGVTFGGALLGFVIFGLGVAFISAQFSKYEDQKSVDEIFWSSISYRKKYL